MKGSGRALADRARRGCGNRKPRRRRSRRAKDLRSAGLARTWLGGRRPGQGGAPGLSALRGSRHRRLGTRERSGALPLQELRAHVQRPDQDGDGGLAQEGAMARPRPGDDRGDQRGQGRRTLRRPPHHGVPLATPVFGLARAGQAQNADRPCRSGRDVHPRIVQGPQVRSSPPAAQARRQGQAPGPVLREHPPSSWRATARAQPPTRCCPMSTAPLSQRRSTAWSRPPIGSSATAARRSSPSPAEPTSRSMSFPRRASPAPRRPTSTSTTSTPITAGSRNGWPASTASPPRTCPTIWDGDERSRPGETGPLRKTGSSAPSESALINRQRYKRQIQFTEKRKTLPCLNQEVPFSFEELFFSRTDTRGVILSGNRSEERRVGKE